MTETIDTAAVIEAMSTIDEGLARFASRGLVSSDEISDLLLDLRGILAGAAPPVEPDSAPDMVAPLGA